MTTICNRIIAYAFYTLFFLVPLIFSNNTSELFELNKMWLTFALTVIIGTTWFIKMLIEKRIHIQRTPLDIPLLLFLFAHIISTLFSLDTRVSFWGYYSRFNGGLLSIASYVFLYYAFVSNLSSKEVKKTLWISLVSALFVGLWGLPSHFGYDPTCYVFRGDFDVSCWTDAFKPTIRMFSTLGQPAWLAAYLAAILPIAMALGIMNYESRIKHRIDALAFFLPSSLFLILYSLFYSCLLYANTRAGFLGFWIGNGVFWALILFKKLFSQKTVLGMFLILNSLFLILNFLIGTPFADINKYLTYNGLHTLAYPQQTTQTSTPEPTPAATPLVTAESNITESGDIRKIVWQGAIDAWKANPMIGSGVETFAFAYYQYRPIAHNTTSEWDYLYNKAHNEYLNYLTTTGMLGLGSYLAIIGLFLFIGIKKLVLDKTEMENVETQWRSPEGSQWTMANALIAGYITILVTNFFGFSVVIMNLYLFLIPAWFFLLTKTVSPKTAFNFPQTTHETKNKYSDDSLSGGQWVGIIGVSIVSLYILLTLLRYLMADTSYAMGYNLYRVNEYEGAYTKLAEAVQLRPNEPVFTDELSVTTATLATAYYLQKDSAPAEQKAAYLQKSEELLKQAIQLSDFTTENHPTVVPYWKSRVRVFYMLSQIDPHFLTLARNAIERAHILAPTDAKIMYNYGILLGQTGDKEKGIQILEQTVKYKPDYRDGYYALALSYHESGIDEKGKLVNATYAQKAIDTMHYILKHFDPQDEPVIKTLKSWGVN